MGKNMKSLRAMSFCLGIAISVLGLVGCASSERHHAATHSEADKQLATDVADSLSHAPGTTFPDVAVRAKQGRVELKGYVANDAEKTEAERIASQVPGVTHVDNDLSIKPGKVHEGSATSPGGTMPQ